MKVSRPLALISILAASIAGAAADEQIKAQPISLSAAVGNEQSDFFITEATVPLRRGQVDILPHLVFSALTKTNTNGTEQRVLFKQKLERISPSVEYYWTVDTKAPLKKLNTFVVPQGTQLADFKRNRNSIGPRQGRPQQFFRVPGKGLYVSTGGGVAALIKAESPAAPLSGYALRSEDHTATDTDSKEKQFRVVLGASTPAKGYEPYISAGSALSTKLLQDIVPGSTGSLAQQFTSYFFPATATSEVFFVANNPAAAGGADVFRTTVTVSGRVIKYGVASLTDNLGLGVVPSQLTGSSAGLFFTALTGIDTTTSLLRFDTVNGGYTRLNAAGQNSFTQLTPNIDDGYANIGFSANDPQGNTRFGRYSSITDTIVFPEIANAVGVHTKLPDSITSTGNYYYFNAFVDGFKFVMRSSTGSSTLEFVDGESALHRVFGATEFCYVYNPDDGSSLSDGTLYFVGTADLGPSSDRYANVLFRMDANQPDALATPVLTPGGNYVVGAKNLRSVGDASIRRLYFCAPVNATTNAEFAKDGLDYGTKPWVVNVP